MLTLFLTFACEPSPDQDMEFRPFRLTGKVPDVIRNHGNLFGQDVINFQYENCGLASAGLNRYEYDENSRVKRIYFSTNRYEEYEYEDGVIVSSAQYRKDNEEEGYLQRLGYEFSYENDVLSSSKNTRDDETTIVTYDEAGSNIVKLETYDSEDNLLKESRYWFDSMKNIRANLPLVSFGNPFQGRRDLNNVTYSETRIYGDNPNQFATTYTYKYEDEYPVVVYPFDISFLADSIEISYVDCR